MGHAYLLTGEPKIGKTTALKTIVSAIGIERCGGFYTQEVRFENKRTGFNLVTLDGQVGKMADVNFKSSINVGKYGVNLDCLNSFAIDVIYEAISNKEFIIVDEIGPMQLYSDKFKQAISDIMGSPKPLIGTIVLRPCDWADELKKRAGVNIYRLELGNRNDIDKMLNWIYNLKS